MAEARFFLFNEAGEPIGAKRGYKDEEGATRFMLKYFREHEEGEMIYARFCRCYFRKNLKREKK